MIRINIFIFQLFGMLCIAADIYYILLQTCQVDYPGGSNSTTDNSIALFHNQYILGNSRSIFFIYLMFKTINALIH